MITVLVVEDDDAIRSNIVRQRAVAVVTEVANALAVIHERGIIHRDLKPENIMRRVDGATALADFGIAKPILEAENLDLTQTRHGDVVGYYLSPEQASGRQSRRSPTSTAWA